MQTVGNYLRKEREAKNLSIHEVSRITKITERYIVCLEKDDYDQLPQGPYIKGYIATYARSIGSDEDQALQLYDSRTGRQPPVEAPEPETATPLPKKEFAVSVGDKFRKLLKVLFAFLQVHCATTKEFAASLGAKLREFYNRLVNFIRVHSASWCRAGALRSGFRRFRSAGKQRISAILSRSATGPATQTAWDSIKTILASLRPRAGFRKTAAGFLPKISLVSLVSWGRRTVRLWLAAGLVLVASGILVLAGFGFYHLFIFDEQPSLNADSLQRAADVSGDIRPATDHSSAPKLPPATPPAGQSNPSPEADSRSTESVSSAPEPSSQSDASDSASKPTPPPPERSQVPARDATSAQVDLTVLKAAICTKIKNRKPVGVGNRFPWTTKQVYVWSMVGAKHPPSKVRHIYYHNDRKISDVTLVVGSGYWRTWSFKYISGERYKGPWRVDIATAKGQVLRTLYFEVF